MKIRPQTHRDVCTAFVKSVYHCSVHFRINIIIAVNKGDKVVVKLFLKFNPFVPRRADSAVFLVYDPYPLVLFRVLVADFSASVG